MKEYKFGQYKLRFEATVIHGATMKLLGKQKMVPVRKGKLSRTAFGKAVGDVINSHAVIVIDYYGHMKKSIGFIRNVEEQIKKHEGMQVRMVESMVVHVASIKIEQLVKLTEDPQLVAFFPLFKADILKLRGFK